VPLTGPASRTLLRYAAFQVPGVVVVLIVLALAHRQAGLPLWAAAALCIAWIAKDVALYPFVRGAYEPSTTPFDRLAGAKGTVVEAFEQQGLVRVGQELWKAELPEDHGPLGTGEVVVVKSARRMTLVVYRAVDDA
jgi:membrane protein implicated in regulation of membrane protease activity|tara:strand:- start:296 stop:703 length:408 start_codon:yes stop_codon:yes gene_type:complete